jgi:hypothetical protein
MMDESLREGGSCLLLYLLGGLVALSIYESRDDKFPTSAGITLRLLSESVE